MKLFLHMLLLVAQLCMQVYHCLFERDIHLVILYCSSPPFLLIRPINFICLCLMVVIRVFRCLARTRTLLLDFLSFHDNLSILQRNHISITSHFFIKSLFTAAQEHNLEVCFQISHFGVHSDVSILHNHTQFCEYIFCSCNSPLYICVKSFNGCTHVSQIFPLISLFESISVSLNYTFRNCGFL